MTSSPPLMVRHKPTYYPVYLLRNLQNDSWKSDKRIKFKWNCWYYYSQALNCFPSKHITKVSFFLNPLGGGVFSPEIQDLRTQLPDHNHMHQKFYLSFYLLGSSSSHFGFLGSAHFLHSVLLFLSLFPGLCFLLKESVLKFEQIEGD